MTSTIPYSAPSVSTLGAQIDAHRERAETIEAISITVAYLAGLPVPGYTGTHNPLPTESYCDTAARLAAILYRLAKAHRDIAAHNALPSFETSLITATPEPSGMPRRLETKMSKLTRTNKYGQRTFADIINVAASTKRNQGHRVYRATPFCVPGERNGWNLLSHEYRTMGGLLKAASEIGAYPVSGGAR